MRIPKICTIPEPPCGVPASDQVDIFMAKILIPTPLRQYTDKQDSLELSGSTVGEVLTALTSQHPELRKHLYNDEGKLRSFVNVYLNDEDIRYLNRDATAVGSSDTLSIVPSIAGGAEHVRR